MDCYEIWFNLKDSRRDLEFAGHARACMERPRGLVRDFPDPERQA